MKIMSTVYFRLLLLLLLSAIALSQSQATSQQQSLTFFQMANSFDPENLHDPETYDDIPDFTDRLQIVDEESRIGKEVCVICQGTNTEGLTRELRKLIKEAKDLKKFFLNNGVKKNPSGQSPQQQDSEEEKFVDQQKPQALAPTQQQNQTASEHAPRQKPAPKTAPQQKPPAPKTVP